MNQSVKITYFVILLLNKDITKTAVEQAIILNEYFLKQKLYLAGYTFLDIKKMETNEEENVLEDQEKPKEHQVEKCILLEPGPVTFLTTMSKKKVCKKTEFEKTCEILQKEGLGELDFEAKEGSRKGARCFKKKNPMK